MYSRGPHSSLQGGVEASGCGGCEAAVVGDATLFGARAIVEQGLERRAGQRTIFGQGGAQGSRRVCYVAAGVCGEMGARVEVSSGRWSGGRGRAGFAGDVGVVFID